MFELLPKILAVIGTIGALWLTLQVLRKSSIGLRFRLPQGPRISIEQRVPINNGCELLLVRWDGREMLLATGTQSCRLVATGSSLQPARVHRQEEEAPDCLSF